MEEHCRETSNWLTVAAMSGGLLAFRAGLAPFRHAQRWKRAEFVANEWKPGVDPGRRAAHLA
jgi:hypothetical protein